MIPVKNKNFRFERCKAAFESSRNLQRHLARKRPCEPILDVPDLPPEEKDNSNRCRYCGRAYGSSSNLARHLKCCKIANTGEGMERLLERTVRRQLAEQASEMSALRAQVSELAALLKGSLASSARNMTSVAGQTIVNNGPSINNSVHIQIRPWSDEPLLVPVAMLRAAFAENPRLVEYCQLSDEAKVDAEGAAPYVLEALVDVVRRAHADPTSRNVYLNPRRADQVLVFVEEEGGRWRVQTLVEAIRTMFDCVANGIRRVLREPSALKSLPPEMQASAAWVPMMYEGAPEDYVAKAKGPMVAHLANAAPHSADRDDRVRPKPRQVGNVLAI
jgi:hypothetical protein